MLDKTQIFSIGGNSDDEIRMALATVYEALREKGYNPINQIVGYILSEDPTYITTHNNARNIIRYSRAISTQCRFGFNNICLSIFHSKI